MPGKIVLIEDEKLIRTTLEIYFRKLGFEVAVAGEPECPLYRGEGECQHEFPCADFLIVDNNLPRMSGLAFIREQTLRGCKAMAPMKAVMSGDWNNEELQLAMQLGCRIFTKPFDLQEFRDWLASPPAGVA